MKSKETLTSLMAELLFFLMLISVPLTISHQDYRKQPPQAAATAALFIFGDSLFDPGNNNYINTTTLDQANFSPYGESYFSHPTGRFSDGRLISDFIAEHAELPLIPPYLQQPRNYDLGNYHGVNFASAGAGALSQTFQGQVIDLKTQLKYYKREVVELRKKIGNAETANISSAAVYLFSIGTNDYMSPFLLNSTLLASYNPHSKYVDIVLGNLSSVVKTIHKIGGRKFVFLNLPEIGCLPGLRILKPDTEGGECLEEASNLAKLHNKALQILLQKMEKQLEGFKYFLYDFKTSLAQRMAQPQKYGLKEGKAACCGTGPFNGAFSCGGRRLVKEFEVCENPNEYVFWDSYHLTERVNKQMALHMWNERRHRNTLKELLFLS